MKKSKKEKNGEIAKYTAEQISNLIIGFMPGWHVLNFWGFRNGLKQKRLLDFAESLKKTFESELNIDLDDYDFQSENFVDLFDSIMNQVQITKSEEKLNAFKGIFVNSLINDEYHMVQVYIDLTTSLHEKQIEILNLFIKTDDDRKKKSKEISKLSKDVEQKEKERNKLRRQAKNGTINPNQSVSKATNDEKSLKAKLERTRNAHRRIVDSINAECFNLEESQYIYFLRDLISKGLLVENTYVSFDTTIVDSIDATSFALAYYNFVTIDI